MQTRILVADDNAEIREILRILLTGEGYEVIEAKDGNEVLQLFDSSIDLIVLDIMVFQVVPMTIWQSLFRIVN